MAMLLLVFTRTAIAATFGISLVGKLRAPTRFANGLPSFGVPTSLNQYVAWIVIVLEATVIIALLLGGWAAAAGFALAIGMLLIFSAALLRSLARGQTTACNCFGPGDQSPISTTHLYRNGGLVVLCGAGLLMATSVPSADRLSLLNPTAMAPDQVALAPVMVVAALSFSLVWSHLVEIAALLRTNS